MASLAHHLPSLLLFISLLYTSINGGSAKPSNTACPSFDCGDGITISYPFWHQDQQFEFCGYPGFGLSCKDQSPKLHLSNDLYHVKKINYSENTLTLSYVEVNEGVCPRAPPHNVTLTTSSLFNYTVDDMMLRFFYNCTLYPPSIPSIACLQYGAKHTYVFTVGAIPEFDWHGYCESIVTVVVIDNAVDGLPGNGFGRALQDGFKLTWQSNSACQSCEATGGFCGYSNGLHQNFFCFCTDGRHSSNCHDKGVVSIKLEPNFVAIAALIFGGLIIASTVFYFIQRKKIALDKPVFSRIPSSWK